MLTLLAVTALLAAVLAFWPKIAELWYKRDEKLIYDFTRLDPTRVGAYILPRDTQDISDALGRHTGKVCVGGGRFSMGGQVAYPDALHIDMRGMNKLLSFDKVRGIVTVQAGMTWRELQRQIAPYWAVKIMQSYNAFTVGGSLNVNVHGRYIGEGPLVLSVLSFKLVQADGSVLHCSRYDNHEIFKAVPGSMGAFGVVAEVTLQLATNQRIKRVIKEVPTEQYLSHVENVTMVSPTVFHNGDIRLSDYCTVRVTDWVKTEDALTVRSEFRKEKRLYLLDRLIIWLVTELPFGVALKQRYLDPWMSRGNMVVTRNYEASVNPRELFPTSWLFSTYVLQEYFVPASGFISFAKSLQAITKRHKAKILNVSIRHARRDDDSLLNWARHPDIFCFVLYYKQRTSKKARERVGLWTRQLVDSVLAAGGTYYLPYQLHPTKEQFSEAYPMVNELVRIKRELDPDNRFTSKFWDKYLPMAESKNKEGEVGP